LIGSPLENCCWKVQRWDSAFACIVAGGDLEWFAGPISFSPENDFLLLEVAPIFFIDQDQIQVVAN